MNATIMQDTASAPAWLTQPGIRTVCTVIAVSTIAWLVHFFRYRRSYIDFQHSLKNPPFSMLLGTLPAMADVYASSPVEHGMPRWAERCPVRCLMESAECLVIAHTRRSMLPRNLQMICLSVLDAALSKANIQRRISDHHRIMESCKKPPHRESDIILHNAVTKSAVLVETPTRTQPCSLANRPH